MHLQSPNETMVWELNMKKNHYSTAAAVIILVLALLSAIGVRTFMSPCVHDDGSFGSCHWAGQALFGLSIVIAAQSMIAFAWKNFALRQGLYLAMTLTAVLGLLIPGPLIKLCSMADMRCRMIMRPAAMILYSLILVLAAAGMLLSGSEKRSGKEG